MLVTKMSESDLSDLCVLEQTTSECFGPRTTPAIETSFLAANRITCLFMTVRELVSMM